MNIYEHHKIPFKIQNDDFFLSIDRDGENCVYKRECGKEKEEKLIIGKNKELLIYPIEPLTRPKNITPYLLIKFEHPFVIKAKTSRAIYIKFPIEIGVFLLSEKEYEMLDTFTLLRPKYTLYGNPKKGNICRYFQSAIYTELPSTDICREGVIQLKVVNKSPEWIEVSKVVFNAYGMKIYYDDKLVCLNAEFEAQNRTDAETGFIDSPLNHGMNKSTELFSSKKLALTSAKFVMREGL